MLRTEPTTAALEALRKQMEGIDLVLKRLEDPNTIWSDEQVRVGAIWYDRDVPTPEGQRIWASDGEAVWLIVGSGKPIEPYATAVKFWTDAFVPAPPANGAIIRSTK